MASTVIETPFILHERQRRELWVGAWLATANANDCKQHSTATRYADEALAAFDARFKYPVGF